VSVLVTGGTGFVGLHVLRALAAAGERVVSLSTRGGPDGAGQALLGELAERVLFVKAEITDLAALREILRERRVTRVVHGAAITAIGDMERQAPHAAVAVNVGGTAAALEAARLASVRRFVYLSSATIYGSGDPAVPIPEDRPIRPAGIYAITKQAAEALVLRYMELFGLDPAILRISAPYGPLEHPTGGRQLMSPIYAWCRAALAGRPVDLDADLERDFTWVGDTAGAVAQAVLAPALRSRIYNVACGHNVRFSEVLETLGRVAPGLTVTRAAGGTDAFFRESLRGPLDIARARRELGWEPRTSLADGLRSYVEWLRVHPA
jgi:UDP-glucuronate 4-epimerase